MRYRSWSWVSRSILGDDRGIERVIDADAYDIVAQPHAGRGAGAAEERARAEIEIKVFELSGPVAIELLLDAGADGPARPRRALGECDCPERWRAGRGDARIPGRDRARAAGPELLTGHACR